MKRILFILFVTLLVSALVYGQKQPFPTFSGGTQATRSAMLHGPHDFTPDSGKTVISVDTTGGAHDTTWHPYGASRSLCGYCHAAHINVTGIAQPLWIRASVVGRDFGGVYQNPNSLDATVEDIGSSDNYSSFCMGCHDGSFLFTASAYTEGRRPRQSSGQSWNATHEAFTVDAAANIKNGDFNLQHVHPVNFNYVQAQAADPQGIYPAQGATYVWRGDNGSGQQTSARLFNNYMQCSSCHNPHMNSGIGVFLTGDYGKRCVACHKK
jgi:predicted CXXCH cytochrome family protein